ncbi:hypothetical protein RchiOBHm_Chr1g0332781 [Rosa chinensis]|uniref:Uncharacterized protein n=1 Tax=Rosa chinensis TaxID=74649 RepID=A0A2P6SBW6_ROSCH|nr:hypothetical protein RchiOBHm_Chr1g0332781 [Rosa chinensis]
MIMYAALQIQTTEDEDSQWVVLQKVVSIYPEIKSYESMTQSSIFHGSMKV